MNCLISWIKIGAAPLTRACLQDPQVRKSMDSDKDFALLVNSVQEVNDYAVYALTEGGYDGLALQGLIAIKPADNRMGPITERMSREQIELLAHANTHGKKFFATCGHRRLKRYQWLWQRPPNNSVLALLAFFSPLF